MALTLSRVALLTLSAAARYASVVSRELCLSQLWMVRTGTPASWWKVAKVLRNRCKMYFEHIGAVAHDRPSFEMQCPQFKFAVRASLFTVRSM